MNGNSRNSQKKNDKNKIEAAAALAAKDEKYAFIELAGMFSPYISSLARSFDIPSGEYDDLCQIGMIALYKAVKTYETSRQSFTTYARVCIKNAMVSFVRDYYRKNKLDGGVSLDDLAGEYLPSDPGDTPEDRLLAGEFIKTIGAGISSLSEAERTALRLKLSGMGTAQISVMLGKDIKSVENTLFRARKKLRTFLGGKK